MSKIVALTLVFVFSISVKAQQPIEIDDEQFELPDISTQARTQSNISTMRDSLWSVEFRLGRENRFEPSIGSSDLDSLYGTRFEIALKKENWLYGLEYGEFKQDSSTGSLSVAWERRETLLSVRHLVRDYGWWTPVLGMSAGVYRETVETQLLSFGQTVSDSDLLAMGTLNGGLRFQVKSVSVLTEARLVKRETSKDLDYSWVTSLGLSL